MIYVLDANVALKWVLPEPDSAKALQLRADVQAGLHQLIAPDFFPVEIAHALTRAERKGDIPLGDADLHLLNILSTPPTFHPSLAILRRAVAISSAVRIGVYDCVYVALAEQRACQLLTADAKLVNHLQGQFPFIVSLMTLP